MQGKHLEVLRRLCFYTALIQVAPLDIFSQSSAKLKKQPSVCHEMSHTINPKAGKILQCELQVYQLTNQAGKHLYRGMTSSTESIMERDNQRAFLQSENRSFPGEMGGNCYGTQSFSFHLKTSDRV